MDMPLRYPMVHRGSRSIIIDHIHSKLPEKDREWVNLSKGFYHSLHLKRSFSFWLKKNKIWKKIQSSL